MSRLLSQFGVRGKGLVWSMALVYLPGTFIHELSHFTMAKMLGVRTGRFSLLPKDEGGMIRLGSVEIEKVGKLKRLAVGIAPFLIGLLILTIWLSFFKIGGEWWRWVLGAGVVFVLANTMFSSKKDLEGVVWLLWGPVVLTIALLLFLHWMGVVIPYSAIETKVFTPTLNQNLRIFAGFLIIPVFINLIVFLLGHLAIARSD